MFKNRSLIVRVAKDKKNEETHSEPTNTVETVEAIAKIVDNTAASIAVTVVKSACIIIGVAAGVKILTSLANNLTK